jgi:transcriptional regulator with XRE-family HTH domain
VQVTTTAPTVITFSSEKLRALRLGRNLSQLQLARAIAASDTSVLVWERGDVRPNATSIAKLCTALGCRPNDLFNLGGRR